MRRQNEFNYYNLLIDLFIYCISQTWQHVVKFSVNTGYNISRHEQKPDRAKKFQNSVGLFKKRSSFKVFTRCRKKLSLPNAPLYFIYLPEGHWHRKLLV